MSLPVRNTVVDADARSRLPEKRLILFFANSLDKSGPTVSA
jgi:hypothetical protein